MITSILQTLSKYGHVFLQGAWGTIWISFVVVLFGSLLGAIIALLRMINNKIINFILTIYVEIIRGTPILLQLYILSLGLGSMFPRNVPEVVWILLALVLNSSAYVSEVIRSGIQAVDKGQFEAAKSLGLSNFNMMHRIIIPQAIKNILPALGNEFVTMIKETSLAAIFFIPSLMTSESLVTGINSDKFTNLLIVGIFYLAMTIPLSRLVAHFERKLSAHE